MLHRVPRFHVTMNDAMKAVLRFHVLADGGARGRDGGVQEQLAEGMSGRMA
jgi:hypothetical protein